MTSASRTPASSDDSPTTASLTTDWEAVRQAYVNHSTPVRDICQAHGIFSQTLYRRAGKEGWPRRREPREDAEARKTWKLLTRLRRLAKGQIDQIEARRAGKPDVSTSADAEFHRLIAEVNQGGDMVEAVVREVDPSVSFKAFHAPRGKQLRAEPVAALYEQGRAVHVRVLSELEDELMSFGSALR